MGTSHLLSLPSDLPPLKSPMPSVTVEVPTLRAPLISPSLSKTLEVPLLLSPTPSSTALPLKNPMAGSAPETSPVPPSESSRPVSTSPLLPPTAAHPPLSSPNEKSTALMQHH